LKRNNRGCWEHPLPLESAYKLSYKYIIALSPKLDKEDML